MKQSWDVQEIVVSLEEQAAVNSGRAAGSSPLGGGGLEQGGGQEGGDAMATNPHFQAFCHRRRPPPNLPPVPTASRPGGRKIPRQPRS